MSITIDPKELKASHRVDDSGRSWLYIDIPNGWDDVKKIKDKVLTYGGKKFLWSCWNSDALYCVFREAQGDGLVVARIS